MAEGSRHFHEAFPGVVKLRHGVAHAGEAFGTPANVEKNAASGSVSVPGLIELSNVGTAIVTGNLVNRKYTTMIEGKLFTYELSASSLSSLRRVQEAFWDTFRPIASR